MSLFDLQGCDWGLTTEMLVFLWNWQQNRGIPGLLACVLVCFCSRKTIVCFEEKTPFTSGTKMPSVMGLQSDSV